VLTRRALTLGGAALGVSVPCLAFADDPAITLGIVQSGDFLPAIVADRKGFFKNEGLDVRIVTIPIISNIPAGLTSGSMQMGVTTGATFIQAVANGLDLVVVSGNSRFAPDIATASLIAGKDAGLKTAKDLRGKRIAVPGLNSVLDLLFRRWLIAQNMDPKDLQVIEASFPQMADLLRSRQVDCAIMKEPFIERAITSGAGVRLVDYIREVDPNGLNVFWIATGAWARAHATALPKFRAALEKGFTFVRSDPESHKIEMEVLRSETKVLPHFDTKVTLADLKFEEDLSRQFGLIDKGALDMTNRIAM
jgi:NitT/TauT family transport system substrate-binding protein